MLDNTDYNNISIDNYKQEILHTCMLAFSSVLFIECTKIQAIKSYQGHLVKCISRVEEALIYKHN